MEGERELRPLCPAQPSPARVLCPQCGQTPLMIAAEQGNLEIVKELIKNGANCNLEDLVPTAHVHAWASLFLSWLFAG